MINKKCTEVIITNVCNSDILNLNKCSTNLIILVYKLFFCGLWLIKAAEFFRFTDKQYLSLGIK